MSRGPLGWAKEKAAWGIVSEVLAALAFHAGGLGTGERAKQDKERVEKWLKSNRKRILTPLLEWHRDCLERGEPMGKALWQWLSSPGLWATLLPAAIVYAPKLQERLDPESFLYALVASMLPMAGWILVRVRAAAVHERAEDAVRVETATEHRMIQERGLVDARRSLAIEERRLLHEQRQPGHTTTVTTTTGLDLER